MGNWAIDKCPICGDELEVMDVNVAKMFNRIKMMANLLDSQAPAFVVGRQKTMIAYAAKEIIDADADKYPAIPLDLEP